MQYAFYALFCLSWKLLSPPVKICVNQKALASKNRTNRVTNKQSARVTDKRSGKLVKTLYETQVPVYVRQAVRFRRKRIFST